jgi:hypothetical protein
MALEWLPGALIAAAGGGLSWWKASDIARIELEKSLAVAKVELAKSIEQLKSDLAVSSRMSERTDDEFKRDLYAALNELRGVTLTIAKLTSGQDVINAMNGKALESIVRKQEEHDKAIAEIRTTTSLITEWFRKMEEK